MQTPVYRAAHYDHSAVSAGDRKHF